MLSDDITVYEGVVKCPPADRTDRRASWVPMLARLTQCSVQLRENGRQACTARIPLRDLAAVRGRDFPGPPRGDRSALPW